jgi:hypothetical protein
MVLIAHAGCAYYREQLHVAPAEAEAEQTADLERAATLVRRLDPRLDVQCYFARLVGGDVAFEHVVA